MGKYVSDLKASGNTTLVEKLMPLSKRKVLEAMDLTNLQYKSTDEIENAMNAAIKALDNTAEDIKKASGKSFEKYQPKSGAEVSKSDIMSFESNCIGIKDYYKYSLYGEEMRIHTLGEPLSPSEVFRPDITTIPVDLTQPIRHIDTTA